MGLPEGFNQGVIQGCRYLKTGSAGVHFQAHSRGCWWDSSVHIILSREFLQFLDMWPPGEAVGFYQCKPPRMPERSTKKRARLFCSVPRTDFPTFLPHSCCWKWVFMYILRSKAGKYTGVGKPGVWKSERISDTAHHTETSSSMRGRHDFGASKIIHPQQNV